MITKINFSKFLTLLTKYIKKLNVTKSVNISPRIDRDSVMLIELTIVTADHKKNKKYRIKGKLFIELLSSFNRFFFL